VRKVIASEFVSLNGVMEDPSWIFRLGGEEQERYKFEELAASDALLMGRVLYEEWAAYWPEQDPEENPFAGLMNGYPKYVVSTTLQEPLEWNDSKLIKGHVAGEVHSVPASSSSATSQQRGKRRNSPCRVL
jgi:dihydrofolate reductase